jgi:hypothetical protein
MMIVLKKVCFLIMTLLLLISGCIVFVLRKVMMISYPKHWDHILPDADIHVMHAVDDHEDGDVPIDVVTTRSQSSVSKLHTSGELPVPSGTSNSGEKVQELSVSNRVGIDDMLGGEHQVASSKPMLQDYKKFKHGKEVPQEAEIQYLKQHLLTQALVHHKHVMYIPHDLLDPDPTNTVDFIMMASRAYSTKNTWYVEYEVTGSPEQKEKYLDKVIQIPAVRGTVKSTNHESNVLDLIKQMYPKATTLADIGITKAREEKILQVIAESYSVPQSNPDKEATRKRLEVFVQETRASETVAKAITKVQQRQKEDSKPLYSQITETFEPTPESIWENIDMLEGDAAHMGYGNAQHPIQVFLSDSRHNNCSHYYLNGSGK